MTSVAGDWALPERTYRRVDTASKLVGVVLVAAALAVGPGTPAGAALALVGTALATVTVFIDSHE